MYYNYQQEAQMEAFRRGLSLAYNPPASEAHSEINPNTNLILVKDVHTPDPRDRFGIGQTISAVGDADIVWTSEASEPVEYGNDAHLPRIHYVINPESTSPHKPNYKLADYKNSNWAATGGSIIVTIWDPVKKEYVDKHIPQSRTKVYVPEDNPLTSKRQVMVLLSNNPSDPFYREKEIISSADVDNDRDLNIDGYKEHTDEIIIEPEGADWGVVTGFKVVDFQEGEINPDKTASHENLPANEIQGLLPDKVVTITRDDSLKLEEESGAFGYYRSTSNVNSSEEVIHKIRTNTRVDPDTFTNTFQRQGDVWQTPK
jgi:hypothetical protein